MKQLHCSCHKGDSSPCRKFPREEKEERGDSSFPSSHDEVRRSFLCKESVLLILEVRTFTALYLKQCAACLQQNGDVVDSTQMSPYVSLTRSRASSDYSIFP